MRWRGSVDHCSAFIVVGFVTQFLELLVVGPVVGQLTTGSKQSSPRQVPAVLRSLCTANDCIQLLPIQLLLNLSGAFGITFRFSITDECRQYSHVAGVTRTNTCWLSVYLVRMDESADARRILTAVPQSAWRRPVGRPYTSWMATLKNDLALHNLTLEDAIELALDKPLWRLLAGSGATH